MSTEIELRTAAPKTDLLASSEGFEHAQRVAKMFASSELIPPQWRGKVADCAIAFTLARQLGESPLQVLQSLHVVNGRAGWSAQYMIARANSSGIFKGRINWRVEGQGDDLRVTAFATLADSGNACEFTCSMRMAKTEGWTKNPKYASMPDLMLRYRSAALLIRLYAPDVMLGYHTVEELGDISVGVAKPTDRAARVAAQAVARAPAQTTDAPSVVSEAGEAPAASGTLSEADIADALDGEVP